MSLKTISYIMKNNNDDNKKNWKEKVKIYLQIPWYKKFPITGNLKKKKVCSSKMYITF